MSEMIEGMYGVHRLVKRQIRVRKVELDCRT